LQLWMGWPWTLPMPAQHAVAAVACRPGPADANGMGLPPVWNCSFAAHAVLLWLRASPFKYREHPMTPAPIARQTQRGMG